MADSISADHLKDDSMRFITANAASVSQTDAYAKLKTEQPALMIEIFEASMGLPKAPAKKRAREEASEGGLLTPEVVRGMTEGELHRA